MYEDIHNGFQKIQNSIPNLRAFKRASMIGVILPTGGNLETFLPTYIYIAIVSILDDALQEFITNKYPKAKPNNLGVRIQFLKKKRALKNAARLDNIRNNRNDYAHKVTKYASWDDLDILVTDIQEELKYLGIL